MYGNVIECGLKDTWEVEGSFFFFCKVLWFKNTNYYIYMFIHQPYKKVWQESMIISLPDFGIL